jgi:hypothetical protein
MADGALMICMIEFSGICAKEGLHQYLEHRRKVIADGNEDQLISSRVKKYSQNVYNKMSSRSSTPLQERPQSPIVSMEETYKDPDENKSDVDDEDHSLEQEIGKKVLKEMPPMSTKSKSSLKGFNTSKILNYLKRTVTPTGVVASLSGSVPLTPTIKRVATTEGVSAVLTEITDDVITDINNAVKTELTDIENEINPEFGKFVMSLVNFVINELKTQKLDGAKLQKQTHYTKKLITQLIKNSK